MRGVAILVLGLFTYTSYFYWLKYPIILDKLFKMKDRRLNAQLSKIWILNINARAMAVHRLMEKRNNQAYIENGNPLLLKNYLRAKKYWYWSLIPLVALIIISQIETGYEMIFEREQFQEKVKNSWFNNVFK